MLPFGSLTLTSLALAVRASSRKGCLHLHPTLLHQCSGLLPCSSMQLWPLASVTALMVSSSRSLSWAPLFKSLYIQFHPQLLLSSLLSLRTSGLLWLLSCKPPQSCFSVLTLRALFTHSSHLTWVLIMQVSLASCPIHCIWHPSPSISRTPYELVACCTKKAYHQGLPSDYRNSLAL